MLYVLEVIERGNRRLKRVAVTVHLRADWTLQQLQEVVGEENSHRYLLHDRNSIFAKHLDELIKALGLRVLKSPPWSPKGSNVPIRETLHHGLSLIDSNARCTNDFRPLLNVGSNKILKLFR
jgi:hypothetical protein